MKRIGIISAGLLFLPAMGWTAEDWQLKKDKDGIKVYTRSVPGSKVKEFQATMFMRTTVDSLVALYLDVGKATAWLPDCKAAKLVEKTGDTTLNVYHLIDNPWPIKDRDYVLRAALSRNRETGEATIDFSDVKDAREEKCCVRMGMVKGRWQFSPQPDGRVLVVYRYHFHPGGGSPPSMVNMSLPILASETLSQMNGLVRMDGGGTAASGSAQRAESPQ